MQEQVRQRGRGNPEFFGEMPHIPAHPFVVDSSSTGLPLPGTQNMSQQTAAHAQSEQWQPVDVFVKSEKCIGQPPVPSFKEWVSRETEIIGWVQYVLDLSAWASQASLEFGSEISQATKWTQVISWGSMTLAQRSRSMR